MAASRCYTIYDPDVIINTYIDIKMKYVIKYHLKTRANKQTHKNFTVTVLLKLPFRAQNLMGHRIRCNTGYVTGNRIAIWDF